jgi:hypothetical protein
MFADEARFGRMNRPRPCWAPAGVRPRVASQLIREYTYLYGAVCPKDGTCVFLIMPASDTECFQIFLDILAKKFSRQHILLFVDGAPNHHCDDLVIPANITLQPLPPYAPELLCGVDIYVALGLGSRMNPALLRFERHITGQSIGWDLFSNLRKEIQSCSKIYSRNPGTYRGTERVQVA